MSTRIVGVLGGMGPGATVEFMRRIQDATAAVTDQDHIRMIVDCNPQVPDRTDFILGNGPDPRPFLLNMVRGLERAGAELLVMPCNTAHYFLAELKSAANVPIVDWTLETASAVSLLGVRRAGVLATSGTLVAGIYPRAFDQFGIQTIVPGEMAQGQLMKTIYDIKKEGVSDSSIGRIDQVVQELAGQDADVCVVACTEVSWACKGRTTVARLRMVDSMDAVVSQVVLRAGGRLSSRAKFVAFDSPRR